jgi:adenosylmethionine-8-amino-7-oxononanoate aminotransferase
MERLVSEVAALPGISQTRQMGFVAAIDIAPRDDASGGRRALGQRVCLAARPHGLLTRPIRDTIVLMPPYCISEAELSLAFDALHAAIAEVCG